MARDLHALDIDELRSAQVERRADARSSEDLSLIGCIAGSEVFSEDAGMLRRAAGGNDRVLQGRSTVGPSVAPRWIRSNAPGATANDDSIPAGDNPGVVVEGLVVPEKAIVIEGAMLALRISHGSGIRLSIADGRKSAGTAARGVAWTSVWADVPCRGWGRGGGSAEESGLDRWKNVGGLGVRLGVADLRCNKQQGQQSGEGFDLHSQILRKETKVK